MRRSALAAALAAVVPLAGLGPSRGEEKGRAAVTARLAAGGKALQAVVVADASAPVRECAETLAQMLGRITGATFTVQIGDGSEGIALGTPAGFPKLALEKLWDAKDPTRSEDYLLRSHARGIYAVGATEAGVRRAAWDLLYRLGYRQFFPGPVWEVVPRQPELSLAVDALEHPSFYARRIWYGFGAWDYAEKPYADWCERNRATSGILLNTGHSYDALRQAHPAAFAAHPEYHALVGEGRRPIKFCIANPELRRLVVAHALARFAEDPGLQSVSMDPSDGGGWCECPRCAALGSVTDRALTLANEVAAAVEAGFGPKYVGMYAYNQHSPPPGIRVHPRVVISVATAFITGGYTVDDLLDGWQKQGATLGIREYYSVNTWDRDLPGAARGANPDYLKTTIPHFHAKGARFLSSESSDNWGPNGLGYYLAARMLWDVGEAGGIGALVEDFLEKAFGPAREPMAQFYRLIDGSRRPLLSDDLLGRMYRQLADAAKLTQDPAVRARLDDLVLYTRYVELYAAYSTAQGTGRQQAFGALVRHAYRMRKTMMVHARALYRDLPHRDKSVAVPQGCAWNVPEGENPWKSSNPFTREELDRFVTAGIAVHPLLDFEAVSFGQSLAPAPKLQAAGVPPGDMGGMSRGVRTYYTWVERAPAEIRLKVQAGLIYGDRGPAKLDLYPATEPEGKTVDHAAAPPDKEEREVVLRTSFPGLHRVQVADGSAGTRITWPDGMPMALRSSPEDPAAFHSRWSLYFYVPKGTRVVGGYAGGPGTLCDGDGKPVHVFEAKPGYYRVPVAPGQDGRLWRFERCSGPQLLMTVPPYLARSGTELLLPTEVIERDLLR